MAAVALQDPTFALERLREAAPGSAQQAKPAEKQPPQVTVVHVSTYQDPISVPPAPSLDTLDVLTVDSSGLVDLGAGTEDDFLTRVDLNLAEEEELVKKLLSSGINPHTPSYTSTTPDKASSRRAKAATGPPVTFGHSRQRARQVKCENERLVRRLERVTNAQPRARADMKNHDRHMANMKAGSAAQQRVHEEELMRSNLAQYRRLQAVQPSKDLDCRRLNADFRISRRFAQNLRMVPDALPYSPPMQRRKEAWNEHWQQNRPSTC